MVFIPSLKKAGPKLSNTCSVPLRPKICNLGNSAKHSGKVLKFGLSIKLINERSLHSQICGGITLTQFLNEKYIRFLNLPIVGGMTRSTCVLSGTEIVISLTEANSLQFPVGSKIDFVRANTGNVTFASAPANTFIQSANSATKIRLQWAACTLIKTTSNTWVLVGDITT